MLDFLNSLSFISGGFIIALLSLVLTYFFQTKNNLYKILFSILIALLTSKTLYWFPCLLDNLSCTEQSNWEMVFVLPWFIIGFLTSILFQLIRDKYKKV